MTIYARYKLLPVSAKQSFIAIVVNGLSEKDGSRHDNQGKAAGDVFEVGPTDNVQTIFRDLENTVYLSRVEPS